MKYQSIIFDLDGTLTDSEPGILDSVTYAFEQLGKPVPPRDQLRVFIGPPLSQTFAKFGFQPDEVELAIIKYREVYNVDGKFNNNPYEGIYDLLKTLKEEGFQLYVGTSKPEPLARDILNQFNLTEYFDEIAGATMDRKRETKSDVLNYLSTLVDLDKSVMVGDTFFDVEGANQLGIPCICVSWGFGNVDEMKENGALCIVDTMEQLHNALKG